MQSTVSICHWPLVATLGTMLGVILVRQKSEEAMIHFAVTKESSAT